MKVLADAGCKKFFDDKLSGSRINRSDLAKAMEKIIKYLRETLPV